MRPKAGLLALHVKLQKIVASKLILDWSPEQISGWLKNQYPEDESMRVSHETIYRSLFMQARGVLKKELIWAPADEAAYPPLAAFACAWTPQWRNRGCDLHPGKARRNRGPRHSRPWGRRSAGRVHMRKPGDAKKAVADADFVPKPKFVKTGTDGD